MATPEFKDRRSSLEIGELIRLDPVELIRNNPAGFIVNEAQYGRMNAYFSHLQFQPVQVARVIVSTPLGEQIEMKLIDGNTRTKFAADNKGKVRPEAPDYSFDTIDGIDVTDSLLRNPLVVYPGEQTGQKSLTTMQYLRAVVEHTIVHSEIVVDRIAAHLVNGWEDMVGENIARRFSALAALTLLWGPNISLATDALLKRSLDQQGQFMAGESREERNLIEKEILEMASIIRSAKLSIRKEEITRAAFNMVMKGSPEIGGEESAQREVEGLLYLEALEVKLAQSFPDLGSREEVRLQFGQFLKESLKKPRVEAQQIIDAFQNSIKDPELTLDQVIGILTSDSPRTRYNEIKVEINAGKLEQHYQSTITGELSEIETNLIKQLGAKTYLSDQELPVLSSTIANTKALVNQADSLRDQLLEREKGPEVPQQIIEAALQRLNTLREELLSSNTRDNITRRSAPLRELISEINERVSVSLRRYDIGRLVDSIYGEGLKRDFEEPVRTSIIAYILRENLPTDARNKERLETLKSLDRDLQLRVIPVGGMLLSRALDEQKMRTVSQRTTVKPSDQAQNPLIVVVETPPTRIEEPTVIHASPPLIETTVVVTSPAIEKLSPEEERIKDENERFANLARAYLRSFGQFNLAPDALDSQTKESIDSLVIELVKLRGGDEQIIKTLREYFSSL